MANNMEKAGRGAPLTCCKPWRVSKTLTGLSTRSITHQCTFKADLFSSPLCQYRKPIFFVRVMPVQAVEVEEISQNPGTEVTWIDIGSVRSPLASCCLSLLTGHRSNWMGNWKTIIISCQIQCSMVYYSTMDYNTTYSATITWYDIL